MVRVTPKTVTKQKEARTMKIYETPKELDFTGNYTSRWLEVKRQFQDIFWEDLKANVVLNVRSAIQDQIYDEFNEQIGAKRYERAPGIRNGERSGRRFRNFETEYGMIQDLEIPRARNLDIRFSIFDKWQRIQPKVLSAMLYAYLLARSSNSASRIVQKFGISRYSRSFYQKLAKNLEQSMDKWLNRPIEKKYQYVFIDGKGVKVYDSYLKDKVIIWAIGMDEDMKSELLGYVVANSESEHAVRSLLIDLQKRGLKKPKLFISDESKGICSAVGLEYPHVEHQICAFHKMQNIQKYLENMDNRKDILADASKIYSEAANETEALERLNDFKKKWKKKEPGAVKHFSRGFEKTLRYLKCPKDHRVSIYTNNPAESFISRMSDWTRKFKYFEGKRNLDLAIFTYFYSMFGEFVLDMNSEEKEVSHEKRTLFIA
jgi:putative transposase